MIKAYFRWLHQFEFAIVFTTYLLHIWFWIVPAFVPNDYTWNSYMQWFPILYPDTMRELYAKKVYLAAGDPGMFWIDLIVTQIVMIAFILFTFMAPFFGVAAAKGISNMLNVSGFKI